MTIGQKVVWLYKRNPVVIMALAEKRVQLTHEETKIIGHEIMKQTGLDPHELNEILAKLNIRLERKIEDMKLRIKLEAELDELDQILG
jgi:hypothetical protein